MHLYAWNQTFLMETSVTQNTHYREVQQVVMVAPFKTTKCITTNVCAQAKLLLSVYTLN